MAFEASSPRALDLTATHGFDQLKGFLKCRRFTTYKGRKTDQGFILSNSTGLHGSLVTVHLSGDVLASLVPYCPGNMIRLADHVQRLPRIALIFVGKP